MTTDPSVQILIVDDDPGQRSLLESFLQQQGYLTLTAASGSEALEVLDSQVVSMMISDVRMPGMSGLEALAKMQEKNVNLPVLMVTAFPDIRDAVSAVQSGAVNYLEKPIDLNELLRNVQNALGSQTPSPENPQKLLALPDDVIAVSSQMQDVFREAAIVAPSETRILITGESGTGKEVIADYIHANSSRTGGPLIKVNCAAIPDTLLESELFGHEKGAFTGAVRRRIGHFEAANNGTIFLDEIGEMPLSLQAKLLRIIQDGSFQRLGSNKVLTTNARILTATNRNLENEVEQKTFREDLLFRLNVFEIYIPSLREREADVVPLANHFAYEFSDGKPRFSPETMRCLNLYDWPGNVRELRNAMERAALVCQGGIILPEHLPKRIRGESPQQTENVDVEKGSRMEDVERSIILQTLRQNSDNRTKTAKSLGISRRALQYKLQRYKEQGYE